MLSCRISSAAYSSVTPTRPPRSCIPDDELMPLPPGACPSVRTAVKLSLRAIVPPATSAAPVRAPAVVAPPAVPPDPPGPLPLEPPASEPPASEPPELEPPVSEPPELEPPVSEPPEAPASPPEAPASPPSPPDELLLPPLPHATHPAMTNQTKLRASNIQAPSLVAAHLDFKAIRASRTRRRPACARSG
jgi:hypothetical protein